MPGPPRRRPQRRGPVQLLQSALSAALLCAACGPTPQPAPIAPPAPPRPAPPQPDPPLPARWIETTWRGDLGPTLPDGTLVLLGGRRALLAPDGSLRSETTPAPELLSTLIAVPTPSGLRVVGRGGRGIYRFDDPLGPATLLARITEQNEIINISPAPGMVAVWGWGNRLRSFLDVETGQPGSLPGLPPLPLKSLAFLTMREGAAVFEGSGLALTTDGGASFHPVAGHDRKDPLLAQYVTCTEGALRVHRYRDDRNRTPDPLIATIDFGKKRLSPFVSPRTLPPDKAPLLRFLERTPRDPLQEAARHGIAAPGGTALIAGSGLVARVDLRTGNVVALSSFPGPSARWSAGCSAAPAGSSAFIACELEKGGTGDLARPFAVARLPLDRPGLEVDPPELVRDGETELRTTPGGGAMLVGPCHKGEQGQACVRQPSGRWISIRMPFEIHPSEYHYPFRSSSPTAPLLDGRLARIVTKEATQGQTKGTEVRVEATGASGKEKLLAAAFLEGARAVETSSPIEERPDKTLRFSVIDTWHGREDPFVSYVATADPAQGTLTLRQVEGADAVFLSGEHGIAVGKEQVFVTTDGGERFTPIPAPKSVESALEKRSEWNRDDYFVSEVGAIVHGNLLLGWGPPEPLPPARPDLDAMRALGPPFGREPSIPPAGPAKVLACGVEGPTRASPPWSAQTELSTNPLSSQRANVVMSARWNLLFTQVGPDKETDPPPRWTVRWQEIDDREAKVHAWTGSPPKGASGHPQLREAAYSEREAVFGIYGQARLLVRVREGGEAEAVEAPDGVSEIVLGAGEGDPVAWLNEEGSALYAWAKGGPRVAVAAFAHGSGVRLEPPAGGAVTVRLGELGWSIPIPSSTAAGGAMPALSGPSDWRRIEEPPLHLLPLCGPGKRDGRRLRWGPRIEVKVDGAEAVVVTPRYEIRGAGKDACLAGLSAPMPEPPLSGAPKPPVQVGKPGPLDRVRVDFAGKRAEGIERPDLTQGRAAKVWRMRCAWSDSAGRAPR